ncbi:hypothetical protein [Kibdelosporangium philippinense]|uniref:hypothetical protein n=1 Tax=Kibdelosporangium philippinense TaxID=211113 RepID=UPI00360B521A
MGLRPLQHLAVLGERRGIVQPGTELARRRSASRISASALSTTSPTDRFRAYGSSWARKPTVRRPEDHSAGSSEAPD